MHWIIKTCIVLMGLVLGLAGWRFLDRRSDHHTWQALVDTAAPVATAFDPESVKDLPEPAQRYFLYTIKPGTPLYQIVELDMEGKLGFGSRTKPDYRPMVARQILAPPHGLVWRVKAGPIGGSDGVTQTSSWTRFWLFGLLPVVRAGNNPDHHRSAFGRIVAEAAFWAPASLLPGDSVSWKALEEHSARATVTHAQFTQDVDITVAPDGQPTRVVIQRWSNENADKTFRQQPFGGDLSDFREFDGYRLPTTVEGGNHYGTSQYFAFYKARVTSVRFPQARDTP